MNVIKQESQHDIICSSVKKGTNLLLTHGFGDELILDKQGAKELIELLNGFVNEIQTTNNSE